jgi:hypothetical protein
MVIANKYIHRLIYNIFIIIFLFLIKDKLIQIKQYILGEKLLVL